MVKTHLAIIIFWLLLTATAFFVLTQNRLVIFDEHDKMQNIGYKEFSSVLSPFIKAGNKGSTIVHFISPGCKCRQTSQKHRLELNKLAKINGFNVIEVVLQEHDVIPSTPSVALTDKKGELVYFGPYGQGLGCSDTVGYAKTMLGNYLKGYSANIVVKDAKGCYCSV